MNSATETIGRSAVRPQFPTLPVLHRAPGHLIRCAQQVNERAWHALFGSEPTSVQYGVLLVLQAQPHMDQRTVGAKVSLDKSNAADVLLRLGRRGLVARERDPADARRKLVALTPAGTAALLAASPAATEVQERIMEPLSAPERAPFRDMLRLVAYRGEPGQDLVDEPAAPVPGWPADLPPVRLDTAPGHLLRRAQQVHTALWAELVGSDVTAIQYVVLLALHDAPGVDQRTLGERASLDKSTGGDVIARLMARRLVHGGRDPADGRRRVLNLTDAGKSLLFRHSPPVNEVQGKLLAPLSSGQQETFVELMRRVGRVGGLSGDRGA